jgi:hypothetical protein
LTSIVDREKPRLTSVLVAPPNAGQTSSTSVDAVAASADTAVITAISNTNGEDQYLAPLRRWNSMLITKCSKCPKMAWIVSFRDVVKLMLPVSELDIKDGVISMICGKCEDEHSGGESIKTIDLSGDNWIGSEIIQMAQSFRGSEMRILGRSSTETPCISFRWMLRRLTADECWSEISLCGYRQGNRGIQLFQWPSDDLV